MHFKPDINTYIPGKIVCVGMNYKSHIEEQDGRFPKKPVLFAKARSCVIKNEENIIYPREVEELDYEVELAVVIGRKMKDIPEDKIPDPQNLNLKSYVNGELRQNGNTSDMIFGVYPLISYISRSITLEAGDLISTGTPAGVGIFMKKKKLLKSGDVVICEIENIGKLENKVISE